MFKYFRIVKISEGSPRTTGLNIIRRNDKENTLKGVMFGTRRHLFGWMKLGKLSNNKFVWLHLHRLTGHPWSVVDPKTGGLKRL